MATKRIKIRNTLAELLKDKLDGIQYPSNCFRTVETRQQFWDEINSFPSISVVNGLEYTDYEPSLFTWKRLNVLIKVFTNIDDEGAQFEQLLEDIEAIIDANNSLEYAAGETTEQISILSVEDDGGILYPWSVGELSLMVQFQGNRLY